MADENQFIHNPTARMQRTHEKATSLLDLIVRAGGYTSVHTLEHLWNVDRRTVRRTLSSLEKRGALTVQRLPVSTTKLVMLTAAGWAVALGDVEPEKQPLRVTRITQLGATRITHTLSVQRALIEHAKVYDEPEIWRWDWETELAVGSTPVGAQPVRADAMFEDDYIEVELTKKWQRVLIKKLHHYIIALRDDYGLIYYCADELVARNVRRAWRSVLAESQIAREREEWRPLMVVVPEWLNEVK